MDNLQHYGDEQEFEDLSVIIDELEQFLPAIRSHSIAAAFCISIAIRELEADYKSMGYEKRAILQ